MAQMSDFDGSAIRWIKAVDRICSNKGMPWQDVWHSQHDGRHAVQCILLANDRIKLTEEMVKNTAPEKRSELAWHALMGKIRRSGC
jgi:hypothetical protein